VAENPDGALVQHTGFRLALTAHPWPDG